MAGAALSAAARAGDAAAVRRLLAGGEAADAKVSEWAQDDDLRPLHLAAYHGHAEVARLLLEHGADPVQKARDSYTPLHYAAFRGQHAVASALVSAGADPLIPDKEGASPRLLGGQAQGRADARSPDEPGRHSRGLKQQRGDLHPRGVVGINF